MSALAKASRPLTDEASLDVLLDEIGSSRFVLLGEASHGTSEYYTWRAKLSKRLIEEHGFSFVAVEGDWPDCYAVNRYVKGYRDSGGSAREVLHAFDRWPTWMWANYEVEAFAEWMRRHNDAAPEGKKAGFYGLDVYSLWESMESIIRFFEKTDGEAAKAARRAYQCFAPYNRDEHAYARATRFAPSDCEDEVVEMLRAIREKIREYPEDDEAAFSAEQNAIVSRNAERYYRAMMSGSADSWNIRDLHMVETLNRLIELHGRDAKAIIWEHNTHIGDARATSMARSGMVNVGQVVRQQHEKDGVYIVGFGSFKGSVIASEEWGEPMQKMPLPEGRAGSWEAMLHGIEPKDKIVLLKDLKNELKSSIGHRAVGVVYEPGMEQYGNYVPSVMPERYDAFIHIDETHALHPMHIAPEHHKIPETYPFGM
ncbi:MAG: erythromycin esterase family protein [Bacteroidota bacterium]